VSYVQLSEGDSRWFTPPACGPGSPELSMSDSDMASKSFTFTEAKSDRTLQKALPNTASALGEPQN